MIDNVDKGMIQDFVSGMLATNPTVVLTGNCKEISSYDKITGYFGRIQESVDIVKDKKRLLNHWINYYIIFDLI